jgi:SAM-dependent methyltransferase
MPDDPYGDPRLVELYDADNPDGPDHDFYRTLADRLDARTIVDLGCGTGLLTVTLARPGRTVIGIDPSAPMLDHASRRPGSSSVDWQLGDSSAIGAAGADLVIMTGNVAQHILGASWPRTLTDLHHGLRPGGTVAFESRNPVAQQWETWTRRETYGTRETSHGPLIEWLEPVAADADSTSDELTFAAHSIFEASGDHLLVRMTLAFRTQEKLATDLATADLEHANFAGGGAKNPSLPPADCWS